MQTMRVFTRYILEDMIAVTSRSKSHSFKFVIIMYLYIKKNLVQVALISY